MVKLSYQYLDSYVAIFENNNIFYYKNFSTILCDITAIAPSFQPLYMP